MRRCATGQDPGDGRDSSQRDPVRPKERWDPARGGPVDRRGRWVGAGFLALVVPLVAVCALGTPWRYAAVTAANAVPRAALVAQRFRRTAADRAGWTTILGGAALLMVHNGQNQVALATAGMPATGSLSAATMALGYLLLLAGGAVAAGRLARQDRGGMLDAAIVGLAAASLMWGVLLHPAHVRRGSSPGTVAYEMLLVLLVTGLTGVIVRILAIAREARTTTLYLLLAIVSAGAADVEFTFTEDAATGLSAWWASALCVVALSAFAAALVHPSVAAVAAASAPRTGLTRWRLPFLGPHAGAGLTR